MINLSELKANIDLEIELSKKESPDVFKCTMGLAELISEALEQTLSADVVPLKHGEWKRCYDGFHDILEIVCSSCGRTGATHFQYCPMCGAKMDGERRVPCNKTEE